VTALIRRAAFCVLLLVNSAGPVAGSEALSARVSPISGLGPCDVVIQAFVEPDSQNRSVFFVIDAPSFYSSSVVTLPGDRAPRTSMVTFRMVPSGSYDVQITLVGDQGDRAYVTRHVEVW
jgi:hypothetical protein